MRRLDGITDSMDMSLNKLWVQTFVSKVMSLIFNMLSRLVMAFPPRSKCHLISWLQSPSAVILSVVVCAGDLLKEVAIIFITSTIVWSQIKQQGGNTAPPIDRKLDYPWDFPGKSTGVGCHCPLQMYSAYKLNKQDDNKEP